MIIADLVSDDQKSPNLNTNKGHRYYPIIQSQCTTQPPFCNNSNPDKNRCDSDDGCIDGNNDIRMILAG